MDEDLLILKELEEGNKDVEWFSKQYSNLRRQYPKRFVAIKDKNVVLAEKKLDILVKKLKEKFGDPNKFIIDFLPDDKYILVV